MADLRGSLPFCRFSVMSEGGLKTISLTIQALESRLVAFQPVQPDEAVQKKTGRKCMECSVHLVKGT